MKFITNCQNEGLKQANQFVDKFIVRNQKNMFEALDWIEQQQAAGFYVGGYFSYEAMQAFDDKFSINKSSFFLAKFFSFRRFDEFKQEPIEYNFVWEKEINQQIYFDDLSKITSYLYEGDVYQINYSFRQFAQLNKKLDWEAYFAYLIENHSVPYAYLMIDDDTQEVILSLSPELFLKKKSQQLISQPMKGTINRGYNLDNDLQQKKNLVGDLKSQAENIMIVDLMRNDFAKICQLNSIKIKKKFEVKTYKSLHQMVTTIEGTLEKNISLLDIIRAIYPAGSITGAPKQRATEIIADLEKSPRNIYTGSMVLFLPNGDFIFNVAIRTLLYRQDRLELGLGSGIVANSKPKYEWQECLLKSHFLIAKNSYDYLFETILYKNKEYQNLENHLIRLEKSANYFQQIFPYKKIINILNKYKDQLPSLARIRLNLSKKGAIKLQNTSTAGSWQKNIIKLKISQQKVDSTNIYLYHKTNKRFFYEKELKLAEKTGYDEVIFFNEKGFLTEGSISNIFIKNKLGQWFTPAIDNGLLAGTKRKILMNELKARESYITLKNLQNASEILICNSIRQAVKAFL